MIERTAQRAAWAAAAACTAAIAMRAYWKRRRRCSPQPRVLVVMAIREEARFLEGLLAERSTLEHAPLAHLRRVRGHVGALRVDVLTSGIGEVDAATATALAMLEDDQPGPLQQIGFTTVEQTLLAGRALQRITARKPPAA